MLFYSVGLLKSVDLCGVHWVTLSVQMAFSKQMTISSDQRAFGSIRRALSSVQMALSSVQRAFISILKHSWGPVK